MIEAKGVSKFFSIVNDDGTANGVTAVNSISLNIPSGKIVSFVGPSGCGKSTFLEMIAGLQAPSEGVIYIEGKEVRQTLPSTRAERIKYNRKHWFLSPLANSMWKNKPKHDIAMMFQDYAVFPWMNVLKNVTFALEMRGIIKKDRIEIAKKYLEKVNLLDSMFKYPSQLSGGMRQRLALARALSVSPKVILMDEPFAAVDMITREKLQEDLINLWKETGITIILVTHDIDEALYLSDEIFVFSSNPGSIRNKFLIEADRPRKRDDSYLIDIGKRISLLFEYDTKYESEYTI
ncbi:MAG: ABC transporter ATP-binding protein [Defluviitaleaceae bacterium]|nr:ABC transporter ATP-binding protein [Defluviitaleaceae bacterium]